MCECDDWFQSVEPSTREYPPILVPQPVDVTDQAHLDVFQPEGSLDVSSHWFVCSLCKQTYRRGINTGWHRGDES
jgi:hypothetical protein